MKIKHFLIISIFLAACNSDKPEDQSLYILRKGTFNVEIVESGELSALQSKNISSPALSWQFGPLKINYLIEDGSIVEKGDTVILFDESEVHKVKLDAQSNLEIAQAELDKLIAEQKSKIKELESTLKVNEINCQIAEIKLEQANYEADVTKKEIKLNLDKTRIDLEKAREEIENQKKIHFQELVQKKLNIKQLQANLDDAVKTQELMTVISPGNGIAIIGKNWNTRAKWQIGDQPWSGTSLLSLPDLSKMVVETSINEVDIAKIKIGQLTEVRLDAFSDKVFTGEITSVATLAKFKDEEKSSLKVFPIEVLLDSVSKELMPGMTVSCKIKVNDIPDVLFIPIEALYTEGAAKIVYLKKGNTFKKQIVKTGIANNDYILIEEGLTKGDVISLKVPVEFIEKESNQ